MSAAIPPDPLDHRVLDPEWGFVHSEQTGSALDGPGLRTVFWLSGCGYRCLYCHNPDTWKLHAGRRRHASELVDECRKYHAFMATTRGGVTLSGGEPLVQHGFAMNVLRQVHALGIHTALDTNGFLGERLSDDELQDIDLVILDLKSWLPQVHLRVTGQQRDHSLAFARRLAALRRPAWIRFVLVPGHTDDPDNVAGLAAFCRTLDNVERVEVLPFHQLGRYKWHELGLPYELEHVEPPTPAALSAMRGLFRAQGLFCPD